MKYGNLVSLGSLYPRAKQADFTVDMIADEIDDTGADNHELQILFDQHAKAHQGTVWLEGEGSFNELLNALGLENIIDQHGFENLLSNNQEFIFLEQVDRDDLPYYVAD